jgi:hypothetical protein
MSSLFRKFMVALTGVVIFASVAARQPSAQIPVLSPYVGADACQDCHSGQYASWAQTKHSKALGKLQLADREGDTCIKCHVTGSAEMIAADGATPSFPNVQCEACHGPGRLHVDAAQTGDSVTARPTKTNEETCVRCHNETSPRFKPFYYQVMVGMVHPK